MSQHRLPNTLTGPCIPIILVLLLPIVAVAQTIPDEVGSTLSFRHVGPVGNRVSTVTGIPGDPNVYYFGAASGGVWRSTDAGHSWEPLFDDQDVQSIGAIALAPSDPEIVWVGTGESKVRSNISHGAGVYRSEDGGDTWRLMGLAGSGRISRIRIHPTDPNTVYVAALGHLYGPQEEKGVYRTRDGGETWERVLFTDPMTGPSDLWMNPADPDHLVAGMWTMHIRTWGRWSGGPNDGLYMTRDGGESWERLTGDGLPEGTMGRIGLTGSPDDPDRIYALIETNVYDAFEPIEEHDGTLWRSDDGGETWAMVNADHSLVQRPHYYSRALAAPDDADEIHFLATSHRVSRDGGETTSSEGGGSGGDHHAMWIDPQSPDRMIVGHDQGVSISTNRGQDWYRPLLPIAQMYHVTVDNAIPYNLYGNRQDGPSIRGPSMVRYGSTIPIGEWRPVGGCESGWAVPDTVNQVVYSGCYEGILDRHDLATRTSRTISVWPDNPEGWAAEGLRYRFQWTFPITLSPHDANTVYVGSQHLHRSRNGGQSWDVISPDLSTGLDSLMKKTGGLTPDDASPTYAAVLFAIAESPLEPGVIWAGTNDGKLHRSGDGGGAWIDVSDRLPGLPPLSTISSIEPSGHHPGTVYVAVDAHQLGDFDPYLFVSEDHGKTWRRIDTGIPRGPLSYTHVLREDPHRPGLLYVGTENGLYASLDRGESWSSIQGNLPRAPVHWLTVEPRFNDLVVATYGRGFWIADDISALQRWQGEPDEPHLFPPRPAYRWLSTSSPNSQPGDPAAGRNAPRGALISYWLPPDVDSVSVEILDAEGTLVRTLGSLGRDAGLNRTSWDLAHTASERPRIYTSPLQHAHVQVGAPGWRSPPDGGRVTPEAVPGRYSVRMTVDGITRTAPLTVLPDPESSGTGEGMAAQLAMALELRAEAEQVAELIEEIEILRVGLTATREAVGASAPGEMTERIDTAEDALESLEMELYDLRMSGGVARQDALRWPRRLYAKITSLAGYISGTDDPPTDQAREVHELYKRALVDALATMRLIRERDVAPVDAWLTGNGFPTLEAAGRAAIEPEDEEGG
ncbi:MAG: hypothetical protein JSU98_00520 [Gemmatimonadales bacterium]|nr:MAG: hypothetical protein JSU98_00520 [Gemmatimonadales bacterium]